MEFTGYFPEKSCMCESPNKMQQNKLKHVLLAIAHTMLCVVDRFTMFHIHK